MKKIVASCLAAIAAALALGNAQPTQAETRCWRSGSVVQCQNVQPYNNYRTYRPYNNYRYYAPYNNYRTYTPYNNYRNYTPYNNYRTYRPYNDYRYYNYNYSYNSNLARQINAIYRQELGRNADPEGLQHYLNQYYYYGWSLKDIHRDIATSNEAYNR
ncbi:hypothetical protein [Pseudanabaena sp. PCC 6802]|uniref:hypothetical protein n=1 Tax=Pseudanabaena sp. PCC 6802 TaxID=118173 RepID=UPI000362B57A|nr:hypothetical protein [Pseudanabaena sp. PCC 6802]